MACDRQIRVLGFDTIDSAERCIGSNVSLSVLMNINRSVLCPRLCSSIAITNFAGEQRYGFGRMEGRHVNRKVSDGTKYYLVAVEHTYVAGEHASNAV